MKKYLFIDASSNRGTGGQISNGESFKSFFWKTERNLASRITSLADEMLDHYRIFPSDIELFAVCTGPGSLTGLRVAASFIRTLSFISGAAVIGIDLFRWTALTLKHQGLDKPLTIRMKALTNTDFVISGESPKKLCSEPPCPECRPVSEMPEAGFEQFGVRFSRHDHSVTTIDPSPEALHELITQCEPLFGKDLLKVLPMYVMPSQAERALETKGC